ncbi:MAG: anhydro-N-acetylmuramic acid kinase, partial [Pseudomonadota bacterium]
MSQAEAIWAAGTMSGTSLDGIDLALLKTDGTDIVEFGPSGYRPYSSDEHTALRHALGTWPTEGSNAQAFALDVVQESHLAALNGVNADIIGFHAQTLNHDPGSQRTFQLGDGAALAKTLGRPVAWDFRSADVAAGGEGAPLAPLFHDAVARWAQLSGTVAFLNLGGVGNITWIREVGEDPLADGAVLAFDTGPANAPINDLMQKHYGRPFDAGAKVAESGQSDAHHEGALLDHPYFKRAIPKSLDRDTFSSAVEDLSDLPPENAVATATAWVSRSVEDGIS